MTHTVRGSAVPMEQIESQQAQQRQQHQHPRQLKALQINVWLDSSKVPGGLKLLSSTILESQADIVSLNEVKNFWGSDFVANLKQELTQQQPSVTWYGSFPGNPRKLSLDADTAILSRYPVLDERVVYRTMENSISRSLIQLEPGQVPIAVYSCHLEYRAYSCYLPRGYHSNSVFYPGWSPILKAQQQSTEAAAEAVAATTTTSPCSASASWIYRSIAFLLPAKNVPDKEAVLEPITDPAVIHQDNLSSGRPEAIQKLLDDVAHSLADNYKTFFTANPTTTIPILIMGDFNEPSALDWTKDTQHTANHNGVVYEWETTRRLIDAGGFVDTYRDIHPNPVTHPGYTWPAAAAAANLSQEPSQMIQTGWIKLADERDRIDYIFFKNHVPHQEQEQYPPPQLTTTRKSTLSLKPIDSWLVGTPIMMAGKDLVDESRLRCDGSDESGHATILSATTDNNDNNETESEIHNTKTACYQDKFSLKVGSPWPSDHRAVMTLFSVASESIE